MLFRILKRAIILISKNLWKFLEWQRIYSCSLKHAFQTDDHRNKKTKKIKQRLKIKKIDLQPIFLLKVLGMSSKLSCATLCTSKSPSFPSQKQAARSFLTLSHLILL